MPNRSINTFQLPDTFWRVSAKAIIFDANNNLLVFEDKNHEWEIPGGGWGHDETFEQCIKRELSEEARVRVLSVGSVLFCYTGMTAKGFPKICIAAEVVLDNSTIKPSGDDLIEARFVNKNELLQLPFQQGESEVKNYINQIWP